MNNELLLDGKVTTDNRPFIVKVYRIFIYSLLYATFSTYAAVRLGIQFSWAWVVLDMIGLTLCFVLPRSLFLLYSWVTISGFATAPVLTRLIGLGQADIIWQAILATVVLFIILSAYVHYSKKDFTYWRAIVFALLALLLLSSIPLALFPDRTSEIIWSFVSVLLFSSYILWETSEIINRYKPGDEVDAAFHLHLDFVGLIWDFISLLRRTKFGSGSPPDKTPDTTPGDPDIGNLPDLDNILDPD